MNQLIKLTAIGIISGTFLALFLKGIDLLTGKQPSNLLFNMDYIPVLKQYDHVFGAGYLFHYIFCIVSIMGLYYILKKLHLAHHLPLYIVVYTLGSGVLYFLTFFSNQPPATTDVISWFYWTFAHMLYGFVVVILIKWWNLQMDRE